MTINVKQLIDNLQKEADSGFVSIKEDGPYRLYCYTQKCVVDNRWNETTLLARGLVIDVEKSFVAATCMSKFFNLFERGVGIEDLPIQTFVAYEKLDGSLIHVWYDFYANKWRATSKGSFNSDQAIWAQKFINKHGIPESISKNITLVCEAIYPENKIVIDYNGIEALFIIAAYDNYSMRELSYDAYAWYFSNQVNYRFPNTENFNSINDIVEHVKTFDKNREGFVIRYASGLRIKIKGEEYLRIHKALSNFTPLAIYEVLLLCDNIDECRNKLRLDLPEEFWPDLDRMLAAFSNLIHPRIDRFNKIRSLDTYQNVKNKKNRKEFAEYVLKYIERSDERAWYFMDYDNKLVSMKDFLSGLRPTGNILLGYGIK